MVKNSFLKAFSVVAQFLVLFAVFTTPSFAVENTEISAQCVITVNGVSAVTSSSQNAPANVPIAFAGSVDDERTATFPVTVTLSEDAVANYAGSDSEPACTNDPNPNLQLAAEIPTAFGNRAWYNEVLTGDGTNYTGTLTISELTMGDLLGTDTVIPLDIETKGVAGCYDLKPICRRAYVRFNVQEVENSVESCEDTTEILRNALEGAVQSTYEINTPISVALSGAVLSSYMADCGSESVKMKITRIDDNVVVSEVSTTDAASGLTVTFNNNTVGNYSVIFYNESDRIIANFNYCVFLNGSCTPPEEDETPNDAVPFSLCNQLASGSDEKKECCKCATGDESGDCSSSPGQVNGVWTAVGCIETDPTKMVGAIMKIALSVAGGVTVLVILAAGFLFSTSQGDPKRTSEAKEMMTSAVVGLLFILFSVTILQFIGVDILQIPGFGGQ